MAEGLTSGTRHSHYIQLLEKLAEGALEGVKSANRRHSQLLPLSHSLSSLPPSLPHCCLLGLAAVKTGKHMQSRVDLLTHL